MTLLPPFEGVIHNGLEVRAHNDMQGLLVIVRRHCSFWTSWRRLACGLIAPPGALCSRSPDIWAVQMLQSW